MLEKTQVIIDSPISLSELIFLLDWGLGICFDIAYKYKEEEINNLYNNMLPKVNYVYKLIRQKKEALSDYLYGTNFLS